ncbi:hypothetical protein BDV24DRAFT_166493 [Aspergillus arachidicola]|uniref:Uncharacterized protein n=1 Tax=Aspergillus arachidicola TaxID=656916 RepID=A0A5N6XYQ7_9EURO|nr:hypothetical protein BDV24DRAFT_166493 [Aspergillus arachidicola]
MFQVSSPSWMFQFSSSWPAGDCLLVGTGWDSILYLLDIHLDSPITHQSRSELLHLSLSIMPGTVGRPSWLKKLRPHRRPAPYGDMLLGQTPNQPHAHMRLSTTDSCLLHFPLAWHRGQVQLAKKTARTPA